VIGGGAAGRPLAVSLARAGQRTIVIEPEPVVRTCAGVNRSLADAAAACARVAEWARRGQQSGQVANQVMAIPHRLREHERRLAERLRTVERASLLEADHLELVTGRAHFTDPRTLELTASNGQLRLLSAEHVFIDTGTRPALPPVQGLDEVGARDPNTITELDEIPGHLLVIGGGPAAVEHAQMFRRFGSEVTIVQRNEQLLPREDEDVAREVMNILLGEGISVLTGTEARRADRADGQHVNLLVASPTAGERSITGTHLLAAAGHTPNTEHLNLPEAGIETDAHGYIRVDDLFQTTAPGIYALGSVTGEPPLRQVAYDDCRIVRQNLLEGSNLTRANRILSYVVLTDPPLGRVGMTERAARAALKQNATSGAQTPAGEVAAPASESETLTEKRGIRVARMPVRRTLPAVETGEPRGMLKAVVDAQNDRILGGAMLAACGGELAGVLLMAMIGHLPYTAVRDAGFAHSTLARPLNELFRMAD
jgi:pyruvate/2-oxoglutarate dehydrogenase complex dihydrolipoamide dehydrogenase (E3) component